MGMRISHYNRQDSELSVRRSQFLNNEFGTSIEDANALQLHFWDCKWDNNRARGITNYIANFGGTFDPPQRKDWAGDFTVERGSVRYFGDLNAALDIQAQHVVRAVRGEEVPVIAKITGTLYAPKVSLESTLNPPISETDLVSYLVTGYPANEAARLGQANALETGLAYFSSALSSELERALIQDLGIPLDLIEIRPGVSRGNRSPSLSQLAAGWQLGRKTFVTLNAGFCPENLSQFTYSNLGASLEFRLSREWSLLTSIEPTLQSCQQAFGIIISNPYQIGSDIRWEREF